MAIQIEFHIDFEVISPKQNQKMMSVCVYKDGKWLVKALFVRLQMKLTLRNSYRFSYFWWVTKKKKHSMKISFKIAYICDFLFP